MARSRAPVRTVKAKESAVTALNVRAGRHRAKNVLDLLQGRRFLFALGRCNARALVGKVEIVGIGILKAGLVTRLQREPLEESFELH